MLTNKDLFFKSYAIQMNIYNIYLSMWFFEYFYWEISEACMSLGPISYEIWPLPIVYCGHVRY